MSPVGKTALAEPLQGVGPGLIASASPWSLFSRAFFIKYSVFNHCLDVTKTSTLTSGKIAFLAQQGSIATGLALYLVRLI